MINYVNHDLEPLFDVLSRILLKKGKRGRQSYENGRFSEKFFMPLIKAVCEHLKYDGGAYYYTTVRPEGDYQIYPRPQTKCIYNSKPNYTELYFQTLGNFLLDPLFRAPHVLHENEVYTHSELWAEQEYRNPLGLSATHHHQSRYYKEFIIKELNSTDGATYAFRGEEPDSWHYFSFFLYRTGDAYKLKGSKKECFTPIDKNRIRAAVEFIKPTRADTINRAYGQLYKNSYAESRVTNLYEMASYDQMRQFIDGINTAVREGERQALTSQSPEPMYQALEATVMSIQEIVENFELDTKTKWLELCPRLALWPSTREEKERVASEYEFFVKIPDPINGRMRFPHAYEFFKAALSDANLTSAPTYGELLIVNPKLAKAIYQKGYKDHGDGYYYLKDSDPLENPTRKDYLDAKKVLSRVKEATSIANKYERQQGYKTR